MKVNLMQLVRIGAHSKKMPEKKQEKESHNMYEKGIIAGFNICINKILNKEE